MPSTSIIYHSFIPMGGEELLSFRICLLYANRKLWRREPYSDLFEIYIFLFLDMVDKVEIHKTGTIECG